jgi:hypothetical protein
VERVGKGGVPEREREKERALAGIKTPGCVVRGLLSGLTAQSTTPRRPQCRPAAADREKDGDAGVAWGGTARAGNRDVGLLHAALRWPRRRLG